MKTLTILLLFICSLQHVFAQSESSRITDSINKYIEPIISLNENNMEQSAMFGFLKQKKIVSLGESSHGTKEFYDAKTEIIKALVKNAHFKTIFIESDYTALIYLNSIVQGQTDTALRKRFVDKGIYSIYKTKEVYNLINFVKEYNANQDSSNKVSIIGIDMQDLVMIARRFLYELPDSGKTNPKIFHVLIGLTNIFLTGKLKKFTSFEHKKNIEAIAILKEMSNHQNDSRFVLLIRMLEQSYEMMNARTDALRRDLRDRFMAENIIWIKSNFKNQDKSIIWAHNSHISNVPSFTRITMGSYLKKEFKDDLYSMALMFGEGSVRILDPDNQGYKERYFMQSTNPKSFENIFMQAKSPVFFLDFKKASTNPYLLEVLKQNAFMRSIGTTFYKDENFTIGNEPILKCFDGILYFKKTAAAQSF